MADENDLNNTPAEAAEDNRNVTLRLRPVLPVMMEFYCSCTTPPTLLPTPKTMLPTEPPQYRHECPECGETYTLNHSSGSVVFQKLDKPDDAPKLTIAHSLPQ